MGQFKPMVKMMTTEPTVELKLKKGGHVKKAFGGQTPVAIAAPQKLAARGGDMEGKSPKKPSIMERRKSMKAPMLMSKKGGDVSQDKAMIKKAMKQHDAQEHKGGKGTKLKLKDGGAALDKFETKTTIEGNAGKFDKTKMHDGAKKDSARGTGAVKMGKPAGFAMGGTIEGNEGKFKNTKVVGGDKNDSAHGTGGVKMANAGGFKRGGKIMHKAEGGSTNWENRPANGTPPGKTNTKTGEVKENNAGGYKKGGAAKKHFATGGSVNDAGHAVAMPRKPVSQPVANSLQSGTFKKGGKVARKADGGSAYPTSDDGYDPIIKREADRRAAEETITRRENEATPVMDSVKRLLGIRPNAGAGRGFVNPLPRKTGGRAKR